MINELKKIVLFKDFPLEVLEEIASECSIKNMHDGNIVFYEGDAPKSIYLVLSGVVKIYKIMANEHELSLKHFYANELIAEVAVLQGMNYPATAEALGEVKLLKIDFANIKELFFTNTDLMLKIQVSLIQKIQNLEGLLSRYLIFDAKHRVVDYLLKNPEEFFSLKQVAVANLLNISPETLSRVLKPFKMDGIVDMKAKTINLERLEHYKFDN